MAFRFNMHGRDMGTLNVYGKVGPMEQVMWEHNTDRGDTWEGMQINVETSAQFQVCGLLRIRNSHSAIMRNHRF